MALYLFRRKRPVGDEAEDEGEEEVQTRTKVVLLSQQPGIKKKSSAQSMQDEADEFEDAVESEEDTMTGSFLGQ